MRELLILNDAPYGSLKSYNALRLANALSKKKSNQVRVFLMGDAVACAKQGQRTPLGNYNFERIFQALQRNGSEVLACGACLDLRGLQDDELVAGCTRGPLEQLAAWVESTDQVMVF